MQLHSTKPDICFLVQIERFVKHKLDVCRWVGLAVLIVQLLSLGLAYALSAAQQKLLDVSDDDDDEVWGRRRPLLSTYGPSPCLMTLCKISSEHATGLASSRSWVRQVHTRNEEAI